MQLSSQTSTDLVRSMRRQMVALRSLPLMAVLGLFLLFAQVVEQSHSHEADLQAQFDCEICHKIGSLDDITVSQAAELDLPLTLQSYSILTQDQISAVPTAATARGPPSHA